MTLNASQGPNSVFYCLPIRKIYFLKVLSVESSLTSFSNILYWESDSAFAYYYQVRFVSAAVRRPSVVRPDFLLLFKLLAPKRFKYSNYCPFKSEKRWLSITAVQSILQTLERVFTWIWVLNLTQICIRNPVFLVLMLMH